MAEDNFPQATQTQLVNMGDASIRQYYQERAEFVRAKTEEITGLDARVALSAVDGSTVLILKTGMDQAAATRIVEDVLVKTRNESGITREQMGFVEGDGSAVHPIIRQVAKPGEIVVRFQQDGENQFYLHKLESRSTEIKQGIKEIGEEETGKATDLSPEAVAQIASMELPSSLSTMADASKTGSLASVPKAANAAVVSIV